MKRLILLGDSVFDNAAYVAGGPDVAQQLQKRLGSEWSVQLNAVDGSVISGVERQLRDFPADAALLVVSSGGNDALQSASIIGQPAASVAEALDKIATVREEFARAYRRMLAGLRAKGVPSAVCTIYEPRFYDPEQRRLAAAALTSLNDIITREAFARGLPLLDLRLICNEDEDFANPIEPSVHGGAKIAAAIASLAALVAEKAPVGGRSTVFVR